MDKEPSIKIFVTYKEKHKILKSDIITPIQTGRAIADEVFEGMIGDDTGDNISAKNPKYCEISAQYWVWKNYDKVGNPDFIGFMHYRRHFMFDGWQGNPDWCWLPKGNVYFVPSITSEYFAHISDEAISNTMTDTDIVVLKPYDVKYLDSQNIRAQYTKLDGQRPETFDIFIATAKRLFPQYRHSIAQIENGSVQYLCNMFVMTKDLFFEYNNFCFTLLRAVDEQIDKSGMDTRALRFLGYLGEFCLSIFIFECLHKNDCKIKELNGSYILSDFVIRHPKAEYWKYKILKAITFGDTRKEYKKHYKAIKRFIKEVRKGKETL